LRRSEARIQEKQKNSGSSGRCPKDDVGRDSAKGSVLIEFAIAVPVLIALAIAMHDIPKYYRIKAKMEFVAHCAANMFQNVSMNRTNKKVTLLDFQYISAVAFLPYFGGGTDQYGGTSPGSYKKPGGVMTLHYIKGVGTNRAKPIWMVLTSWATDPINRGTALVTWGTDKSWHSLLAKNSISISYECDSDKIIKGLKIKTGEVKMIIDVNLCASWMPDMNNKIQVPPKIWGLLFISPKAETSMGWFHHLLVFTPKPGLFDETPPS
jgi:hypothetical protein